MFRKIIGASGPAVYPHPIGTQTEKQQAAELFRSVGNLRILQVNADTEKKVLRKVCVTKSSRGNVYGDGMDTQEWVWEHTQKEEEEKR